MGDYINPAVLEKETPLPASMVQDLTASHNHYLSHATGKRLFGLYDRGIYYLAVDVTTFNEFKYFEQEYRNGMLLSRKFFAVSLEVAKNNAS